MQRRTLLKTVGGIGTASALGVGALALTGGASASTSMNISDATAEFDDGQLSYVAVEYAGTTSWDGFDVPVKYIEFVSEIRIPDQGTGWHELNSSVSGELPDGWSSDGSGSDGWGGPGEYVVSYGGDEDGLEGEVHTDVYWNVVGDAGATDPAEGAPRSIETPAPWQGELSVDTDGETQTVTLEKRSTVRFLDADQNPIDPAEGVQETVATGQIDVTVTNAASTSGGDGSGDATAG